MCEAIELETAAQTKGHDVVMLERFWQKVLVQAMQDAESNISTPQMQYERRKARAWLKGGSDDFKMVCELANINPLQARAAFQRHFRDYRPLCLPNGQYYFDF